MTRMIGVGLSGIRQPGERRFAQRLQRDLEKMTIWFGTTCPSANTGAILISSFFLRGADYKKTRAWRALRTENTYQLSSPPPPELSSHVELSLMPKSLPPMSSSGTKPLSMGG